MRGADDTWSTITLLVGYMYSSTRSTCRYAVYSNNGIVVVGDNDSDIAGWLYVQLPDLPVDVLVTAGLLLLVTMTVPLLIGCINSSKTYL